MSDMFFMTLYGLCCINVEILKVELLGTVVGMYCFCFLRLFLLLGSWVGYAL